MTYGNGASTSYTYDAARRMTRIEHRDGLGQVMLRMSYSFDARDLPIEVVESDAIGQVAATTYTYDTRGRLVKEDRIGTNPYAMVYEYDQGGNRTRKIDAHRDVEVVYHYDVDDPFFYRSRANRLMYYDTFDTPAEASPALVSTTWYYYNDSGNVTRVVTSDAGSNAYAATRLGYAGNGQAVMYLLNEQWTWDGLDTSCPTAYAATHGRAFKYDGARQRYLDRAFTVEANGSFTATEETWTDYDGDNAYGDYTIDAGGGGGGGGGSGGGGAGSGSGGSGGGGGVAITNIRSFEPGLARVDPWQSAGAGSTTYTHADPIGSRRRTSNAVGEESSATVYTAFGERISGPAATTESRHAYAGAYGYQSHADFAFMHVGHRYYDPATGRFLQRDPIGIFGGLNVYAYVHNNPMVAVDPDGLDPYMDMFNWIDDVINGPFWTRGGTGCTVYSIAKYTYRKLWYNLLVLRAAAVFAGAYTGWEFGKWYYPRAIKPYFDYYEMKQYDNKYAQPFNPVDPWHWAKGTSWEHKMRPQPSSSRDYSPRPGPVLPCFVEGTLVWRIGDLVAIEDVEVGDAVHTWSFDERAAAAERVIFSGPTGFTCVLVEVEVCGEQLRSTPDHPYRTENRGWVDAQDLTEGDLLESVDGTTIRVKRVTRIELDEPVPVYDIRVDGFHWFYVGSCGVLVHNT